MNLFNGRTRKYIQSEQVRHCEHEYEVQDESFDHEFGIEIVVYNMCIHCGHTIDYEYDSEE